MLQRIVFTLLLLACAVATAMFAPRVTGLTGGYARYSHLIGGVVPMAVGASMLLRPELPSFGWNHMP